MKNSKGNFQKGNFQKGNFEDFLIVATSYMALITIFVCILVGIVNIFI